MIIDFEHHYIPAELGRRLGMDPSRKDAVRTGDASIHSQLFDLQAQIRDMDRVGIDVAVQSCILGWDTTLENCRLINDCTAQMQKDYPGRFVGLAHAPVLEDAGLRELERAIERTWIEGRNHLIASQRSIARRQRVHAVLRLDPKVRRADLRSPGAGAEGLQLDERLPVAGDSHPRVRSGCGGDAADRRRRGRTLSGSEICLCPLRRRTWPATKSGSRARRIVSSCRNLRRVFRPALLRYGRVRRQSDRTALRA